MSKNYKFSLIGAEGNLVPVNQHEYWLSPASKQAKELLNSILVEITQNYDIDGIQLDYIRYPFQSGSNIMGFEPDAREKFEIETGCTVEDLDKYTSELWNEWKAKQVSSFVKNISANIHKIKPNIQISAAVFADNREKRIKSIQQDWELWVENGWVDILNPMIYAQNCEKLSDTINYLSGATASKALIYPGIALKNLDETNLIEQINTLKTTGMVGNTLFAMAHLNDNKSNTLIQGPYRNKYADLPTRNPIKASILLVNEFLNRLNILKLNSSNELLVFNSCLDDLIVKTNAILENLTALGILYDREDIENVEKAIEMIQVVEALTQSQMQNVIDEQKINDLTSYLDNSLLLCFIMQNIS